MVGDSRGSILLLLDYDGTLTPIVENPKLVFLPHEMRNLLEKISRKYPTAIITGRSLWDIKNLVGIEGIYYVGNHGFEIFEAGKPKVKVEAEKIKPVIQRICDELEKKVDIEGAIVENKGLTASLHYRLVSTTDLPELKRIFDDIICTLTSTFSAYNRQQYLKHIPNISIV